MVFFLFTLLAIPIVVASSHPPEQPPVPVEIIQDDENAYIVVNSWGDKEEHYFDAEGNEVKIIITDKRGNRFEHEYDASGNLIREVMPEEIVGEQIHTEEQVITETNEKGIVGILYYDTKDRLTKIEEQFVFGYVGVSEYEYYEKMQLKERDGHKGYEWVVKKEVSSLVKENEVKATITKEFDKNRKIISRESQGLTVMFPVIAMIAKMYGYEVSKEDLETI